MFQVTLHTSLKLPGRAARSRGRTSTGESQSIHGMLPGTGLKSLVCDLDRGTVEAVVEERTQASLETYYRQFTVEDLGTIRVIARDMWKPHILATAACVPDAAQKIVFDRYHARRYVKKEAAGSLNLDLVRDNRMPGRGRSASDL